MTGRRPERKIRWVAKRRRAGARRHRLVLFSAALASFALVTIACTSDSESTAGRPPTRTPSAREMKFTDVAQEVGLDFEQGAFHWDVSADPPAMMGSGVCWIDYDGDGWLDLFAVNSYAQSEATRWDQEGGLPRSTLFHNVDGRFEDVGGDSGADVALRGTGCVAADFDLDENTDLYVTSDRGAALLWNNGDGTFTEGAAEAGVEAFGWHAGAAAGDVNGDGWPDLFVAGYVDMNNPVSDATQGFPNTYLGVRDLLYLSNGDTGSERVTYREVGAEAGLEVVNPEYGLGALFSDLDRDGDLDLYVANDMKPNRLYDNVPWPGGAEADPAGLGFRFEELAGPAGVADPNAGMGVAGGDYDGDGRSDLFVTNSRRQIHGVFRGQESELVHPSFLDVRAEMGPDLSGSTGWGVSWADLDLDTDLDLFFVNGGVPVRDLAEDAEPLSAFSNLTAQGDPGKFEEFAPSVGIEELGRLLARGSAAADYDNDGDVDIAINSVGGPLALLENDGVRGNWLEVRLEGFQPGARVNAVLPDGRELSREAQAGSSYLSSEDPRCLFGLGDARRVSRLVVTWPGGERTVETDVDANEVLSLEAPE